MLQEFILLYSLFQRMLCHLLIAKKNYWTYIKKRAILNYFWLFLLYLFSCIRILFVGGKKSKNVFFISAKNLFSSFLYNFDVLSETLKSNMMMLMMTKMFPVTVSACCLCCLNDGCIPLRPTPPCCVSHSPPRQDLPPESHFIWSSPVQCSQ